MSTYRYYKLIRKDGRENFHIVPSSRRLAAKSYCLECLGYEHWEVPRCTEKHCSLYPYRMGKLPEDLTSKDRATAIRDFCFSCSGEDPKSCPSKWCTFYPYRLSGYRTDTSTLIPADVLKNYPGYEAIVVNYKQMKAVYRLGNSYLYTLL